MSKQGNPTLIGAFVVGSVALVVTGLLMFGSGKWLKETTMFSVFFEGSVTGLSVGAPVRFRGVRVGEVGTIAGLVDSNSGEVQVRVDVELEEGSLQQIGGEETGLSDLPLQDAVPFLVQLRDLRAKLEPQSFVTGQLYVTLDYFPGKEPPQHPAFEAPHPEIPAVPSDMQQLRNTLEDAVHAIRQLPIQEIFSDVRDAVQGVKNILTSREVEETVAGVHAIVTGPQLESTLEGMSRVANAPELLQSIQEARDTFAEVRRLVEQLEGRMNPTLEAMTAVGESARVTLEQARTSLASLERFTAADSQFNYQLDRALSEIASAARALRLLAEMMERNPNALLLGKPEEEP